ncbi:MAG: peptidase and in kexin sedolisin, partial [Frankiales bacterium]|nr:peptidase and in kexin sedolisin [Frankiales bacterium]
MRTRRSVGVAVTTACVVTGLVAGPATAGPASGSTSSTTTRAAAAGGAGGTFVVLFAEGATTQAGTDAVRRAGGTVLTTNAALGTATVRAGHGFAARVATEPALAGAAKDRPIGTSPRTQQPKPDDVERSRDEGTKSKGEVQGGRERGPRVPGEEPLGSLQWDMKMIGASPEGSYAVERGDRRVTVGIMDTGVDGKHPDIAPNFSRSLSRNFTVDIPGVDGKVCEFAGCVDPVDHDDNGHGTHVAGTIGSPINGVGIAGVAPGVTLVNLRSGQDSGYFFLQATLDALTYAGNTGIDVVNMSFYIDPWLYNCRSNPADSPEEQQEQRTIIDATQRALNYAHKRGVTLVAAAGNGHTDLGKPVFDDTSPDFPADSARDRAIDNTCLTMPTEAKNVIGVTSVGPSGRKAFYSDYGIEQADVSAPGGDSRDTAIPSPGNRILAPFPTPLARAMPAADLESALATGVMIERAGAYYEYLQGTSMASPHAAGVAALIVSRYGTKDGKNKGGLTLNPKQTERLLLNSATDRPCPTPRTYVYAPVA